MDTPVGGTRRLRFFVLALGVGVLGLAAGNALTLLGVRTLDFVGVEINTSTFVVVSLLLTQGVAFGGVAVAYLRLRDVPADFLRYRLPTLREWIWTGSGYVLALTAAMAAAVVVFLSGAPRTQNQVAVFAVSDPGILLFLIPASFLLIGPGEELLFRGIVQGTLREAFGPLAAVTVASAVFASVHALAYTGGPVARLVGITVLFLPSLVLGFAYERTGNIVVPALVHGAYNATLFAILYLSIQYGTLP